MYEIIFCVYYKQIPSEILNYTPIYDSSVVSYSNLSSIFNPQN